MTTKDGLTHKYESKVNKAYSEVGGETSNDQRWDRWGIAEYKGQKINHYTDEEQVNNLYTRSILSYLESMPPNTTVDVADFGGGDGILLKIISDQIIKDGRFSNIIFTNFDVSEKNLDKMRKDVSTGIKYIHTDILEGTIPNESFDIILSRNVLNYFGVKNQTRYFQRIHSCLKSGGLCIALWPSGLSTGVQEAEELTDLYARITSVILNEPNDVENIKENKYFSSLKTVEEMVQGIGFKVLNSFNIGTLMKVTGESFADRFDVTDQQVIRIKEIIDHAMINPGKLNTGSLDDRSYFSMGQSLILLKK